MHWATERKTATAVGNYRGFHLNTEHIAQIRFIQKDVVNMKISFIAIFLLSATILSSFALIKKNEFVPPFLMEGNLVNEVLSKSSKIIEMKHQVRKIGQGSAMPEGIIKELVLSFATDETLTKNCLRKLLIEFAQVVVTQVQLNSDIQPYLIKTPFTIENVQIIIYNYDKKGFEPFDPEISTAEISDSKLTYRTIGKENIYQFKNQFEETYEEALKAIQAL